MVNWVGAALKILSAAKKEDLKVDPKYIVVKPRAMSDANMLRGVSILRGVLALIPQAAIASPILGLGQMGFRVWKKIALAQEYDQLQYPPMDPNMLRLAFVLDIELNKHYGELLLEQHWNETVISELEPVYNDFQFLTNFEMLRAKYPEINEGYIRAATDRNRHTLQATLDTIEQSLIEVSHKPEIENNIRESFGLLKQVFPAMQDWSLFTSDGFEDILEIVDTVF